MENVFLGVYCLKDQKWIQCPFFLFCFFHWVRFFLLMEARYHKVIKLRLLWWNRRMAQIENIRDRGFFLWDAAGWRVGEINNGMA